MGNTTRVTMIIEERLSGLVPERDPSTYIVHECHPHGFRERSILPLYSHHPFLIKDHSDHSLLWGRTPVKMATQRALLVQEIGKPLVLVQDHPIREPGHGQVQIKVTVAGMSDVCRSQRIQ
jgi:hypothetical protein